MSARRSLGTAQCPAEKRTPWRPPGAARTPESRAAEQTTPQGRCSPTVAQRKNTSVETRSSGVLRRNSVRLVDFLELEGNGTDGVDGLVVPEQFSLPGRFC